MPTDSQSALVPARRSLLKWTGALAGATGIGLAAAKAQPVQRTKPSADPQEVGGLRKGMFSTCSPASSFPPRNW